MKKRMLSALLCLCMMLTMMPAAFAVGTDDSSSSESVSTTLPEAKDGVYTLDEDVSINTIGLGAGETVYDLNGHTLTYTGGTVQPQQGQTLTFRDSSVSGTERGGTLKLTGVEGTKAALNPQTGATVNASNIKVECSGSAFFPQGDAAAVNITSCDVKADVYCVGTNAAATDNYGVKINLTDSTFTATSGNDDDCAVMINVDGTLNIDNCTISGHRQGVLVRAGKANITNSSIKTLGTYSDADAYYDSAWQSGNEVPAAALTVGNYAAGAATAYKANAVVKLTNTKLTAENNFPALYVDANATYSANVTITGDDTNVSGAVMKGRQTAAGAISIAVSGGTFSSNVSNYVDTGYECTYSGSEWVVGIARCIEADVSTNGDTANVSVGGRFSGEESGDVSTENGTLTVTATTGAQDAVNDSVITIASATMSSINAAEAVQNVAIVTDVATVTVDSDAWAAMTENAANSDVVLSVEKTAAIASAPLTYTITAKAGGNEIFNSDNARGGVTVSVPYSEGTTPVVYYVGPSGLENMNATLNGGNLVWVAPHFSDYVVLTGDPEAAVTVDGTVTPYNTLEKAITAANSASGTVVVDLLKNATVEPATGAIRNDGALNITSSMTINGNTYTITADTTKFIVPAVGERGNFHVFNITGGKVAINNLTIDGSAKAAHGVNVWTANNAADKADVTLTNVTIENNTGYGVVTVGSNMTVENITTTGNAWGGINVDNSARSATGGTFTMNSGTLNEDNALYIQNTKASDGQNATINNGTFNGAVSIEDKATGDGDVDGATLIVNNGTFSNSVADYVSSDLKYEVSGDGTFTYYETSDEAQQAASEMDNAVVKVVGENTLYDTVTLDYNDGTGHVDTVYVVEGDTYTLPAATRDNYTFDGWYADDETEPAQTYTAVGGQTVTFTAQWDRNSSSGGGGGSGSSSYAVSVSSVSNGSVTVSPKNASKGATVTITVAPNEGYELGSLTVTDANGNRISLTNAGDGKYTFIMPSSKVTVTATFTAVEEVPEQVGSFTDVNTDDWFAEAVQYMLDNEMMNGTSATTFGPNTTTTRGMIVTILYRLEGEPDAAASSFTDVASNMYYADAINWAAANGIVNGITTTTFGPDNAITREQMAAILYRYAQFKGYDVSASNNLTNYTDASQISAYAATAMQWANAEGLITGNTTTTINPTGNATRAEVATILMRFCENIAG